jgi:protein-tyrosine phosphatase
MAEGALRGILAHYGLDLSTVLIDSAGTHEYRAGSPPFELATEAARKRGYEIGNITARSVGPSDFDRFDHILAMDRGNLRNLNYICPTRCRDKVELLLEYGDVYQGQEIADPYGQSPKEYEKALDMIEDGCRGLAALLIRVAPA